MVIKGSARGNAAELIHHLERTDHNERVHVLDIWGIGAPDLRSALHELDAIGIGARSKRTLYHAQINSRADEALTEEQRRIAVHRLAGRLGLENQPHVVVEHVKKGRQHFHVVWSRIDLVTMKAIPDSHNYRKHEEVARELEREFGHERVQGAHAERDGQERPARTPSLAEMRQAERSGMTPQETKKRVTECWHQTTTGFDFMHRLEAEGFIMARGDRRDFVLIDRAGEIHGLARRVEGVKAAEIRKRMADIDVTSLPDVAQARARVRQLEQAREAGFISAIDRQRAEDARREADHARARLNHNDQSIADAVWQLNRTMRAGVANTIAGMPSLEQRQAFRDELAARVAEEPGRVRFESRQPDTPTPAPHPPPQFSRDHAREVIGRPGPPQERKPEPVPQRPPQVDRKFSVEQTRPAEPEQERRPEPAPQPPPPMDRKFSVEQTRPPEPQRQRPSASLFVKVFGWLIDAYQRALDRMRDPVEHKPEPERQQQERPAAAPPRMPPMPSKPKRESLFDEATRTSRDRAKTAAGKLREQEDRKDHSRGLIDEDPRWD